MKASRNIVIGAIVLMLFTLITIIAIQCMPDRKPLDIQAVEPENVFREPFDLEPCASTKTMSECMGSSPPEYSLTVTLSGGYDPPTVTLDFEYFDDMNTPYFLAVPEGTAYTVVVDTKYSVVTGTNLTELWIKTFYDLDLDGYNDPIVVRCLDNEPDQDGYCYQGVVMHDIVYYFPLVINNAPY